MCSNITRVTHSLILIIFGTICGIKAGTDNCVLQIMISHLIGRLADFMQHSASYNRMAVSSCVILLSGLHNRGFLL